MNPRPVRNLLLAAAVACALAVSLPAQIPDGWYATSNLSYPSFWPGPGGIYLGHPTRPGVAYPVSGLPLMVTGQGLSGISGTDNMNRRPSDGALIVDGGSAALMPHMYRLYAFDISGNPSQGFSAALLQTVDLGTISNPNAYVVAQGAFLPDERMVICVDQVGSPGQALYGHKLGLVDLTAGSASAIPISTPLGGTPNALCVDTSGQRIFLGLFHSNSFSNIYSVPFNNGAGGAPAHVASVPFQINNLALDGDGTLVAVGRSTNPYRGRILRIPATGPAIEIPTAFQYINAIAIEHASGDYLVAGTMQYPAQPIDVYRVTRAGATTPLGLAPSSGWGVLGGLDLNPNPEPYGTATSGNHSYSWQLAPNPGGLPIAGSPFSLQVNAIPGPMPPGVCYLSVNKAPVGIPLLFNIDPGILILVPFQTQGILDFGTLQAHWIGATVFLQSFFFDQGAPLSIAATRGLQVTIL